MDPDFYDAICDGLGEAADLCGEPFRIGGKPVIGDFTGASESLELTVKGGMEEKVHGTLIVSRRRYPLVIPEIMSIITGPGNKPYRIGVLASDLASWTLTLTHPNARRA